MDNDWPRTGIIADIMRRMRNQYHNAVTAVNRNRERFAEAMFENCNRVIADMFESKFKD